MKSKFVTFVMFVSVLLMFIGGCGICDEYGNFNLTAFILAMLGASNILFISRRACREDF